jgi:preprotein translocase subunit SecG
MTILVTILHVFVCVFLILVILLQAGRGQGLTTSSFGAGAQSFLGTKTTGFMKKLTSVCALLFIITSLSLVILSIRRSQSVFSQLPEKLPINLPVPNAQTPVASTSTTTTTAPAAPVAAAASTTTAPSAQTPQKAQ